MTAIEARDVFRVYSGPEGEAAALQGLTLSVAEGEVLVVLGPSGSGKSTLLRILAALELPSAGTVRVLGTDVAKLRGRRRGKFRSRLLGFVEQHYSRALPDLTARELVALQLALAGAPTEPRLSRADDLLERVGLADRRDARPSGSPAASSSASRCAQRLRIARAFCLRTSPRGSSTRSPRRSCTS